MSYSYFVELPRLEDIEPGAHTDVLIANSRVDQGRIRAAVEARSNSRLPTTLNARDQPPAEVSDQRVSGLTGAVQPPFRAEMGCFCVCSAQVQEVAKNSLRGVPESVVMSYSYFVELPRLEDIEPGAHTDV